MAKVIRTHLGQWQGERREDDGIQNIICRINKRMWYSSMESIHVKIFNVFGWNLACLVVTSRLGKLPLQRNKIICGL